MKYIFYYRESATLDKWEMEHHLTKDFTLKILKPCIYRIVPEVITTLTNKWSMIVNFFPNWMMHNFNLFNKFDYSIFIVYSGGII